MLLFGYLLSKLGVRFEIPGQFDDPNATCANIATELKKLGIPFEFGPIKLKQGCGEACISALQGLVDAIMATSKGFASPIHKLDE